MYVDAKSVERNEAYESFSAPCYGASKRDTSHCPSIIATTNKITLSDPRGQSSQCRSRTETCQSPPAPKTAAPRTSGRSNRVFVGRVNP